MIPLGVCVTHSFGPLSGILHCPGLPPIRPTSVAVQPPRCHKTFVTLMTLSPHCTTAPPLT